MAAQPRTGPSLKTLIYLRKIRKHITPISELIKKSPHQVAFGWYGSSGLSNLEPSMERRWMGLPDSLDIISMWSGFPEKDSPGYKEMRFVQEVKGTKIVRVSFTDDIFFNNEIKDFKATYFDNQNKEKTKGRL